MTQPPSPNAESSPATKIRIDFFKVDKVFYTASFLAVALSLLMVFGIKKFNYGTDFTGGVELTIQFSSDVPTTELTGFFDREGLKIDVEKVVNAEGRFILRRAVQDGDGVATEMGLRGSLNNFLKDATTMEVEQSRVVGGVISRENRNNALMIILLAVVFIVLYIALRFRWQYGLAAIAAVVHDVAILLGFIALLGLEVNVLTITAILTIFGYSVNDTIILFDRVRENIKHRKGLVEYREVLNRAVNSIIVRTLITSLTTLLVVSSMYLYAQGALKDFALSLGVGILVGTYSSIYVAGGLMLTYVNRFRPAKLVNR